MSRLEELRRMHAFIGREIENELAAEVQAIRTHPSVQRVCDLYGVRVEELLLGVRRHDVTRARHALTWLLHREGVSHRALMRPLGYSGPSSVFKAVSRVENDPGMRALLSRLEVVA